MPIHWTLTKADAVLVVKIADRADREARRLELPAPDRQALVMDLTAAHANGCPMDFAKLLDAPAADFAHDVYGIARHINRTTGTLEDCFLPRCAQVQS